MRNIRHAVYAAIFVLILATVFALGNTDKAFIKRKYFGAKFEPLNHVMSGAGQEEKKHLKIMGDALGKGRRPLLFITYDGNGKKTKEIINSVDWFVMPVMSFQFQWWAGCSEGESCYRELLTSKQKEFEKRIDTLASGIKSLERPVYLRIGFEVNAKHNGYDGPVFVKLFRKVVSGLRKRGVENFAALWNVNRPREFLSLKKYYPGDEYVDWWSFDAWSGDDVLNSKKFCQAALKHRKPVMIVESTARYLHLDAGDGQKHWDSFFKPYFEGIRNNPEIKGFSYINWNWKKTCCWRKWGDARLQANKTVLENFRREMDSPLYLHGKSKSDFFKELQGNNLQIIKSKSN